MTTRRALLKSLAAATIMPRSTWAQAGSPAYLAAAQTPTGTYVLCGLSYAGAITFQIPLPGRGHAAAAHPDRPEAVAFARRPGTYAIVVDCTSGSIIARLTAPADHHFYGHGAFSQDGSRLYTPENAYEEGRGVIGVWDTATYRRIGEFQSGGIGPHDILRIPQSDTFIVANGGIDTHPDSGRTKLNLPTMRPNLCRFDADGAAQEQYELSRDVHLNSIRHLAIRADGLCAFAMQWQGDLGQAPTLVGMYKPGAQPVLGTAPSDHMQGYAGSITFAGDGQQIAITSPRGSRAQIMDTQGALIDDFEAPDICGAAAHPDGFCFTTGTGAILVNTTQIARVPLQWDNHLVALSTA